MSVWNVSRPGRGAKKIEADSFTMNGTVLVFVKHSHIAGPDGKIQGIPVALLDLTNPNIDVVEMVPEEEAEDAPVVSLV